MMGLLGDIFQEILQLTKFSDPDRPTLFKDAHAHVRKCDIFQRCSGRQAKAVGPLNPVMIIEPFEQWGLDIIGEIKPNSSLQHKYILTESDYFTR